MTADYSTLPTRVIETPPALPLVEFFIPGTPVQQGSKTAFVIKGKAVMTDQNAKTLKPWRATVTRLTPAPVTFDCPVYAEATFVMPRPQKPKFDEPAVVPDIDKLTRALFDGITDAGLWKDDARVVRMLIVKEYESEGNPVGVHVAVSELGPIVAPVDWRGRWERATAELAAARRENETLRAALDTLNAETEQLFNDAGQEGIEKAKSHLIKAQAQSIRRLKGIDQ